MNKLFAVLIVLAICAVGFGFYRGWFAFSMPASPNGGNEVNVNLATDTDKMKEDAQTVKDKAAELSGSAAQGSTEPVDQSTDEVQPSVELREGDLSQGVEPSPSRTNGG